MTQEHAFTLAWIGVWANAVLACIYYLLMLDSMSKLRVFISSFVGLVGPLFMMKLTQAGVHIGDEGIWRLAIVLVAWVMPLQMLVQFVRKDGSVETIGRRIELWFSNPAWLPLSIGLLLAPFALFAFYSEEELTSYLKENSDIHFLASTIWTAALFHLFFCAKARITRKKETSK